MLVTLVFSISSAGAVILPLLPLLLAVDRRLAGLYRRVATVLLRVRVRRPVRPQRRPGVLGFLVYHLADPVAWRAVGYLALRFPLGVIEFALGFVPWLYGLWLTLYPLFWRLDPVRTKDSTGVHTGLAIAGFYFDTWPRAFLMTGMGLVILLIAPWLTRAAIVPDRWLLPRLLGPSSAARIQELEETRATALDAGLEPALRTLAARSPIPATVRVDLPQRPEASVETMLYFSAAELLTNAGKHSKASTVAITVSSDGSSARLVVTDDGIGGATLNGAGSGLRGLAERARTLDGTVDVSSPPGGPTTVTLQVPVRM